MERLKRFLLGISASILSFLPNDHLATGRNMRVPALRGGSPFPDRGRLNIHSAYGAVLKTSNINETIEQIRLPIPNWKG